MVDQQVLSAVTAFYESYDFRAAVIRTSRGDELSAILDPKDTWFIQPSVLAKRNSEAYKDLGYVVIEIPALSEEAYSELVQEGGSEKIEALADALLESDSYSDMQASFYNTFEEISKQERE